MHAIAMHNYHEQENQHINNNVFELGNENDRVLKLRTLNTMDFKSFVQIHCQISRNIFIGRFQQQA